MRTKQCIAQFLRLRTNQCIKQCIRTRSPRGVLDMAGAAGALQALIARVSAVFPPELAECRATRFARISDGLSQPWRDAVRFVATSRHVRSGRRLWYARLQPPHLSRTDWAWFRTIYRPYTDNNESCRAAYYICAGWTDGGNDLYCIPTIAIYRAIFGGPYKISVTAAH
jgi:hypothetical protein